MSFNIELANNIITILSSVTLVEEDITNWAEVIHQLNFDDDPCNFSLTYDGHDYSGIVYKLVGETQIILEFTEFNIVIGSGQCLIVDCDSNIIDEVGCVNTNITNINLDTRLAILDDNGCLNGYITMNQLITIVATQLDIPESLCDLIGGNIPSGSMVAGDRILTTSGTCTLKSVPQSDLTCP